MRQTLPSRGLLFLCAALSLSSSALLAQAPQSHGVRWSGPPGITETVGDIMEREKRAPAVHPGPPRETKTWEFDMTKLARRHDPSAPAVSQWPPVERFSNLSEPAIPQTVGASFLGAAVSESGFIPPDGMGAVGPTQVLVIVNGRIKVFSKSGALGGLNASTDAFFNSVRGAGTTDPHVRYDRLSGRWFVSMLDVSSPNRVLIAVSSGSTITNTSSFTFFQFQHDQVGPTPNSDTGAFADFDTLGVDASALYIGVDVFNSSGTQFLGTTGFVVRKSDLLSGTLTVTAFRQLTACSTSSCSTGPIAPQGVDNDDPAAGEGYFIGVDGAQFSTLTMRRVSNPGGTPSISANITVSVPTTVFPILQPVLGSASNRRLDSIDDRLFAAAVHKNKTTGTSSLWTAHNIEVNSSGTATVGGGRNGSRWYEITNLTSTPTLNQAGTLFDSASSSPLGFWIPSVAMSGQGHMALGSSRASVNNFAEIAVAGRLTTDTPGLTQAPTLAQSSATAYNVQAVDGQRWGDYSQIVVDPADDMTMWTFQEYCNATNSWGVRVIQLLGPPPATPMSASPSSVAQGTTASVTLTGTSVGGSGFFDPGPSFSNRLAATVNGGGVTVNSIAYTSPTQIVLNITVTAGAAPGSRTITVTNPDGQAATSASGILTITASGPVVTVTGISPTVGPAAGGTPVTITGSNFQSGAAVSLGGVAAGSVVFVDAGRLTAVTGAHASGVVDVVVTNPDTRSGTLPNGFAYGGRSFFTVAPCRVLDTRNSIGPFGGPALSAGGSRTFVIAGQCGIPPTALSVAANVTVTGSTSGGFLSVYPAGSPVPLASTINFAAGQTRANNAILTLGPSGDITAATGQPAGTVHFILDLTGYFQ
jgi:IPT/TIG domain-containing protein